MCTVVPSFLGSSCAVCVSRDSSGSLLFILTQTAGMFSKDTAFQHALSSVPSQLLTAIKGSALDQRGVLVAYIDGFLEDGTDGSDITGTGIPTAIATDIVSVVPISSPASSSLAAPLFLPCVALSWCFVEAS